MLLTADIRTLAAALLDPVRSVVERGLAGSALGLGDPETAALAGQAAAPTRQPVWTRARDAQTDATLAPHADRPTRSTAPECSAPAPRASAEIPHAAPAAHAPGVDPPPAPRSPAHPSPLAEPLHVQTPPTPTHDAAPASPQFFSVDAAPAARPEQPRRSDTEDHAAVPEPPARPLDPTADKLPVHPLEQAAPLAARADRDRNVDATQTTRTVATHGESPASAIPRAAASPMSTRPPDTDASPIAPPRRPEHTASPTPHEARPSTPRPLDPAPAIPRVPTPSTALPAPVPGDSHHAEVRPAALRVHPVDSTLDAPSAPPIDPPATARRPAIDPAGSTARPSAATSSIQTSVPAGDASLTATRASTSASADPSAPPHHARSTDTPSPGIPVHALTRPSAARPAPLNRAGAAVADQVSHAMRPVLDGAAELTDAALQSPDEPRVANNFAVHVQLGARPGSVDPDALGAALVDMLREAARRHGLEV